MPIAFDTTGLQQRDQATWVNPANGDQVSLTYFDLVPDLPASLDDLPKLRHDLAVTTGQVGCLIEAHHVRLGDVPALFQVVKVPLPNQPSGQAFIGSFTVPKAGSSAVLKLQAVERGMTGMREAVLVAQLGFEDWVMPHPYAPEVEGRLPFHRGDDPRYDAQFADHPLSRVRAWAHHTIRTARVDPRFAALPPFTPDPGPAPAPAVPEVGSTLTTVVPGLPIGGYLPLWIDDECTFWRMAEPDVVLAKLALGALARTPLTDRRFRDLVALDESSATIMLLNRYRSEDGGIASGTAGLTRVTGLEAHEALTTDTLLEAFRWIGRVSVAAAERGEHVTVEPGTHTGDLAEPYVRLAVQDELSIARTAPTPPTETPMWLGQSSLTSPATRESIEAGGILAMYAMNTWGEHPLRLCLTFTPH
ncbi:hypothetical protein B0I31_103717 [Saccharothrix carnea]|uniref:Uncharacterized protein n=1 Tax=Saccharothrix carnea TaxID=1280637 RepID=A0A2P8IES4_SACCR|nr:hypothetical protein [Saccharothrix carnea]PSL56957.1 hypothetical protein B0I31_103717 [Saccharothrix carnea]